MPVWARYEINWVRVNKIKAAKKKYEAMGLSYNKINKLIARL